MANVMIGTKPVKSIVKIKVNGALCNFIIVHQGLPSVMYDRSCDGTWLLMEDIYEKRQWHSTNVNSYANSTIHSYLNSTFLNLIDANLRTQIKQVKIPYCPHGGGMTVYSGANGLSVKIFLLSGYEVGFTSSNVRYGQFLPQDGTKLPFFQESIGTSEKIAHFKGVAEYWSLRTPYLYDQQAPWGVNSYGVAASMFCSASGGIRPALILPSTILVSEDGAVIANTAPTTPGSITVPESVQGGSSVTVSWTASTDAQGNLDGYILERSVDGGTSWAQIYQGSALSAANTVAFGTQSVMYRVKAYDSEGLSSGWRTSAAVPVINNVAPGAPAFITVPETVLGGQPLTVSWGAATDSDDNLDQYHLERSVNGGDWTEIYSGPGQSFTDSITKGWQTVAYRVRAADALGLFGDYAASPAREVDNNTAPVISCEQADDLGEKNAGFAIPYTVSDAEDDAVTVTEFLDGAVKRTFQAGTGTNSFAVTGESFMKLLNGPHAMLIRASDGKIAATHELTFTKLVTAASVTLAKPMEAGEPITLCALSVSGGIPADAAFKVEVTNNANDASPAWEDCTTAVRNRLNHIFENKTAANGFAFNFRLHVERGESGQGGYITSIQGGFQ